MLPPLALLPNPANPLLFDALAPIQHFVLVASMGELEGSAPGIPGSQGRMGCAPKAPLRYKVCGCRLLQKPPRLKLAQTYRLEPLQSDHRSQAACDLESDAMRFHPSARPWLGEFGESRFSYLGLNPLLSVLKQPALSIFFFGFGKFL